MAGTVPITSSFKDIYTEDVLATQSTRWKNLVELFKSNYGRAPSFISRSPGRVNIIGEHIDYSLYSVLPMAITADTLLAVSTSGLEAPDGHYRVKISNIDSEKFPSRIFDIPYDFIEVDATLHEWTNYVKSGIKGALELLRRKYGNRFKLKSMEILVDGSIPVGGGLSSSAALVCASLLAVLFANGEDIIDKTLLTEMSIISEHAVGVNSGGMDQAASVFSIRGSALYVSFVPSLKAKAIQFPKTDPEIDFVIAQSFVQSNKHVTGPACYNLRVVECSLAAELLNALLHVGVSLPSDNGPLGVSLRGFQYNYFLGSSLSYEDQLDEIFKVTRALLRQDEYTREDIARILGCSVAELNERFMSTFPVIADRFLLRQRALHVFSEARRVFKFFSLLEAQSFRSGIQGDSSTDSFYRRLGDLMNASQDSCRDYYSCSCPEIEELCRIAREAGSYGSRLTGAGWGGCTVHLVPSNKVKTVQRAWEEHYYSKRTLSPDQKSSAVVISKPGSGSAVVVMKETSLDF